MAYQEKFTLAFGIIAVLVYAVYVAIVAPQLASTPIEDAAWVVPMLASIGAAIVAGIIVGIVLGIVSPKGADKEDERDRRIARFGDQVGNSIVVIGAIAAIILSMLRVDWFWIANAVYLAFVISAVLSTMAKLAGYRGEMPTW